MKEIELEIENFGEYINNKIKNKYNCKYIVWQLYMTGNKLKSVVYRLANNTDKQTLDEYRAKGFIVIER